MARAAPTSPPNSRTNKTCRNMSAYPPTPLSPQTHLLAAGGALSSAIKTKGWLWSRAGLVSRDTGMGRALTLHGREICIPTRKTIRMDHADVIVTSPHHRDGWTTSREVLQGRSVLLYWLVRAHLGLSPPRKRLSPRPTGSTTQPCSAFSIRFRWKIEDLWPEKHPGVGRLLLFLKWKRCCTLECMRVNVCRDRACFC